MMFPGTRWWAVRQASVMLLAAWLTAPAVAQSLASVTVSASQASPVSGAVTVTASVSPTTGLTGVQFKLDSYGLEALVTVSPYRVTWSAASTANGAHTLTAEARYGEGSVVVSAPLALTVANPETFNRLLYVDALGGNDANSGLSATNAWRTLAQASAGVQPGDTVYLKGSFPGQALRPAVSGTAAQPIRFTSYTGQTAAIDVGDSNGTTVWLQGAYVIVDGLSITNGTYFSVYLDGGNHNVLRNSTLNATAVYITASNDNLIEGNTITNFGSEAANSGDSLILVNGASRNRILSNTMRNAGHALIGIGNQGTTEVGDNVVAHNVLSNPWANGLSLLGMTRRTVVEYNQMSDDAKNGINYARAGINLTSTDNIIRYNTIFNNAGPGIMMYSYNFQGMLQEAIGNQIYNNTIYGNGQPGLLIDVASGLRVQNNKVVNNIFFGNAGLSRNWNGPAQVHVGQYNNPTQWPANSFNANLFHNNTALRAAGAAGEIILMLENTAANGGGWQQYTLAQAQVAFAEWRNNLEVNPSFVNAATLDFHLQSGSPAIDQGQVIAGGVAYVGVAPDIGAYEFGGTPAPDT